MPQPTDDLETSSLQPEEESRIKRAYYHGTTFHDEKSKKLRFENHISFSSVGPGQGFMQKERLTQFHEQKIAE